MMKLTQAAASRYLITTVTIVALAAVSLCGCKQDAGPSGPPSIQEMRSDPSKMNADQRKMMQEGMKRDAERARGAQSHAAGSVQ